LLRIYCIVLIIIFNTLIVKAQICTGTLGDNIFLEGDFGEGSANILATDPNIAPGYTYTTSVPPPDGSYSITNNMGRWNNLFATWLSLEDNSSNPNGYFMVVNASEQPGLFYEQTITDLCESTLYEFSADFINLIRAGTPQHIDPNVSFLINGVEIFSTGTIAKTNDWQTIGFTFTTDPGQVDLTLALRNNAPGGIGNDLALDNITFRACGPETFISPALDLFYACEKESSVELEAIIIGNQYENPYLSWQESLDGGVTWQSIFNTNNTKFTPFVWESGIYYYRFILADGFNNFGTENCRVISNIITLNILPEEVMTAETLCEGLTRTVGTSIYTETGVYTDTLVNFLGCDSVAITDITFVDSTLFMADIEVTPPSCPDFVDAQIVVDAVSGGFAPFTYTLDGEDMGSASFYSGLAGNTAYDLMIKDAIGCTIDSLIFIENGTDLFLELGEDRTIELGESIFLNPQLNFTPTGLLFTGILLGDCNVILDCILQEFVPTASGQISVELFTEGECTISDSIFIEVIKARKIYFPNAFSPNGDGINDRFTLFGDTPNVEEIESLRVFDRWGSLLFENNNFQPSDFEKGWDGTFRGKQFQTGIYTYSAVVRFIDKEIFILSGEFYLME